MKALFLALTLFRIIVGPSSQEYTSTITDLKSDILNMKSEYANTTISTWDENYISISADVNINMNTENEHFVIETNNTTNGIFITTNVDVDELEPMVFVTNNKGQKEMIKATEWENGNNNGWKNGNYNSMNYGPDVEVKLHIKIPKGMKIKGKNNFGGFDINGNFESIHAYSEFSSVEADLSEIAQMDNVYLGSEFSTVDVSLNRDTDATIKVHSDFGSLYSDFDLKPKDVKVKHNLSCLSSTSGTYLLGNGTTPIELYANFSCIFVRRKT